MQSTKTIIEGRVRPANASDGYIKMTSHRIRRDADEKDPNQPTDERRTEKEECNDGESSSASGKSEIQPARETRHFIQKIKGKCMDTVKDNGIRNAEYIGISDKKLGLFSFMVDVLYETGFIRMECRLRGIIAVWDGEIDTYKIVDKKLRENGDQVILQFLPKGANPAVPFLVEVYLKDGTHINSWLLENEYAKRFSGKELRDAREEREG